MSGGIRPTALTSARAVERRGTELRGGPSGALCYGPWVLAGLLALALVAAAPGSAAAQEHDHAGHGGADAPYAGLQDREIKALSAEEVASLLAGEGMGFALTAELNGYPGPRHVLDLAEELELTEEQEVRTREIFEAMQAEARAVGAELVERERALDEAFASGSVTAASLEAALEGIGALRARLRGVHLRAHLELTPLLTPEQRMRYRHLRGYGTA